MAKIGRIRKIKPGMVQIDEELQRLFDQLPKWRFKKVGRITHITS